jgi:prepilin-type N-terminal cleavage/methylation domain-containing protein
MKPQQGFTLIEVLVVLALVFIIGGIGFNQWLGASKRGAVRSAAVQIAADLERVRSSARRYNRDATFTRGTNSKQYTLNINGNASNIDMPEGTETAVQAGTLAGTDLIVKYTAPNAELDPTSLSNPPEIKVGLANQPSIPPIYIKVVGVTGKVVLSANP